MVARALFAGAALHFFISVPALAQVDARMFRSPDVSATHVTFVYAGDSWVVEKEGGVARKLSSPPGEESFPRFSPDGSRLAFSGNYDGNTDVYVVPTFGGQPIRVTHHPSADRIIDWTPDGGDLLFASNRQSGLGRVNKIFRVSAKGGLPTKLPIPYGEFGAMSPDGRQLAYTPETRGFRNWKRYRGGAAPEIWLFDLQTLDAQNLSKSDANDAQPMWHGRTLYFLSDRGPSMRNNIWAYDLDGGGMRQITQFTDYDITWPAIGPDDIVFQAGGRLYLLGLGTEAVHEIDVDVVTDLAALRPRSVSVSNRITTANISPTGKRAVFEARGEVFTVPAVHGAIRNLTHTSGVAERYPAWSPDGRNVAYWSDRGGEYELTIRPADGSGDERTLTRMGEGYRYRPFWSPDSKKLAFIDHTQTIRIYDIDRNRLTEVDKTLWLLHGALQRVEVSWSSDSRWVAYSRGLETSNTAVFLFDLNSNTRHQVTSGYYNDSRPTFDPDGKYLYYLSNRSLAPVYSDMDQTWIYPNTTNLVAVGLREDVPSPLAPRNDEEPLAGETEEEAEEETLEGETEEVEQLVIELEGFESRAVILPPEAGNYGRVRAASGRVIYHRLPRSGAGGDERPVVFFDLGDREEKTIIGNVGTFEISADGKKMLLGNQGKWAIVNVAPNQEMDTLLATGNLEMSLDPRAEWQQMFTEVWRTYRDYFYDPELHGLDWNTLREHYGRLIDDAVTRWDVNFVIGELIAEINASHTYVGGGDIETPRRKQVGLLGVDWTLENGAYRVARIVRGAPWDIQNRSPITEPGVDVSEGDYILAVNGNPLDPSKDPYAAFEGLAAETVLLMVNDEPTMDGAREILVETLASEVRLRNLEWIEQNRQYALEASDGRIGYIYVPNTGSNGQTELVRQFNYQHALDGLIIDERWNGGGQLADRFVELMSRQLVGNIYFRHGEIVRYPTITHYGHKAMLINGQAGSGGDAFPWFFREMGAGPIVGERTWGGLIGPASGHQLIDGGFYTAPPGRLYKNDGVWFAEGHGVEPDIPVTDHPGELAKGRDPQMDAAIAELLRRIEENPVVFAPPPPMERRLAGSGATRSRVGQRNQQP